MHLAAMEVVSRLTRRVNRKDQENHASAPITAGYRTMSLDQTLQGLFTSLREWALTHLSDVRAAQKNFNSREERV